MIFRSGSPRNFATRLLCLHGEQTSSVLMAGHDGLGELLQSYWFYGSTRTVVWSRDSWAAFTLSGHALLLCRLEPKVLCSSCAELEYFWPYNALKFQKDFFDETQPCEVPDQLSWEYLILTTDLNHFYKLLHVHLQRTCCELMLCMLSVQCLHCSSVRLGTFLICTKASLCLTMPPVRLNMQVAASKCSCHKFRDVFPRLCGEAPCRRQTYSYWLSHFLSWLQSLQIITVTLFPQKKPDNFLLFSLNSRSKDWEKMSF